MYYSLRSAPNGVRYPLVGGTRPRRFAGTNSKPRQLPENAPTPTCRVHAVLGGFVALEACHLSFSATAAPDKIDGHRTITWWLREPIRRRERFNHLLYHQSIASERIKIAGKHPMGRADPWSQTVGWTARAPPSFSIISTLRRPTWRGMFRLPARKAGVEEREGKETTRS